MSLIVSGYILVLLSLVVLGHAYPTGPSWLSYWQATVQVPWTVRNDVMSAPRCNGLQCCCPQSTLNTYAMPSDPGSLYVNGTFVSLGRVCQSGTSNGPVVVSDNLDTPHSGYVTQELFGVDGMSLTLTTASSAAYGSGLLLLYVQNVVQPQCSFVATKPSILDSVSGDVCYNNGQCGLFGTCQEPSGICACQPGYNGPMCLLTDQEEALAAPWLGTYQTTQVNECGTDPSCCCVQGSVNVYMDPSGASRIYINGTSLGQVCETTVEQDDFPIPLPSAPWTSAASLWDSGDVYQLILTQVPTNLVQLTLRNVRDGDCSLVLTRTGTVFATTTTDSTSSLSFNQTVFLSVSVVVGVILIIGCTVLVHKKILVYQRMPRHKKPLASSSSSKKEEVEQERIRSHKPLFTSPHGDDEEEMVVMPSES